MGLAVNNENLDAISKNPLAPASGWLINYLALSHNVISSVV